MLALTDAGRTYYASAKRLLAEVDEVEHGLTAEAAQPAGRLRVTSPTLFGRVHLMPLLAEFLVRYPRVILDVSLMDRPVSLVEEGIDLSIIVGELDDSSLISRRLGAIRWVLSAAPDYLERRGFPATLADLATHDCLIYSQQSNADEWRMMDKGAVVRIRVPVRMRSNTLDGVVTAAVQGAGVVLAPAWAVAEHAANGRLKLLLRQHEMPARPINAILTHNRLLAGKVRTLLDFLAARFDRMDFDNCC